MSEWVRITERVPEIGMGHDFFGLVSDGRSVVTAWYWRRRYDSITEEAEDVWTTDKATSRRLDGYITHWMPMPEPPPCAKSSNESSNKISANSYKADSEGDARL